MTDKHKFPLRLDKDIFKEIEIEAKETDTSINHLINSKLKGIILKK